MGRLKTSPMERLLRRSERRGDCLVWTGAQHPDGYGNIRVDGVYHRVHRLAWQLQNGPIQEGMHVLHRCDNPPCWTLGHLWLGTHKENMADKVSKGRQRRGFGPQTHCPKGHEYTPENTKVKKGSRNCRQCDRDRHRKELVSV